MGTQYDDMCKGLGIVLGTWKVLKCFYQKVSNGFGSSLGSFFLCP